MLDRLVSLLLTSSFFFLFFLGRVPRIHFPLPDSVSSAESRTPTVLLNCISCISEIKSQQLAHEAAVIPIVGYIILSSSAAEPATTICISRSYDPPLRLDTRPIDLQNIKAQLSAGLESGSISPLTKYTFDPCLDRSRSRSRSLTD